LELAFAMGNPQQVTPITDVHEWWQQARDVLTGKTEKINRTSKLHGRLGEREIARFSNRISCQYTLII
jgi:hypothetical protein